MIRWVGAALACLASSVSAQESLQPTPVRLTPKQIEAVKIGVRGGLKDPDSARFGSVLAARFPVDKSVLVCGLVNARNSYGGYTGNGYFIGILPPGGGPFALDRVATERQEYAEAREACTAAGIAPD